MTDAPLYRVQAGEVERDRDTVLSIWRGNLGQDARMAAKFDWFYRSSPAGAPLLLLLRHEASGDWVGVASAGPRRMQAAGRTITAGVLVDLAVLPAHRSLGPALLLQQEMLAAGLRRFDLLYGFPNAKAVPVFKRVGYRQLAALSRRARVLRHGPYLARRLPRMLATPAGRVLDLADRLRLARTGAGLRAEWLAAAHPDMDALWADSERGSQPVTIRDTAFLRWRFDRSPLESIRYLCLRERGGRLRAWFACQVHDDVVHVRDAWSQAGIHGIPSDCVAGLLRAGRDLGLRAVSVETPDAGAAKGWHRLGFAERERRLLFGRGRSDDPALPYLSSADEDE